MLFLCARSLSMIIQYLIFRYVVRVHDNHDVTFSTPLNNFLSMYYPCLSSQFCKGFPKLSIPRCMAKEIER